MINNLLYGNYVNVLFNEDVKECKKGTIKEIMVIPMLGRTFEPGKNPDGKFIDIEGKPDNRIMVMGLFDYQKKIMDEFYAVIDSLDRLHEIFQDVPKPEVEVI